ncbi:MAG: biotin--[acetyl-CoA-carboxylase] ligase [Paludibacter sp.]
MKNSIYLKQTQSTNELLWKMLKENDIPEGFIVQTDFQLAGKGQTGNSWESDSGKNLLFSMLLFPKQIRPDQQFVISQIVSLAIQKTLAQYTDEITIKWPNDIYWQNKKIAGILIENSLQGKHIKFSVIGIGLNINQTVFKSDAPNPVSLRQIIGKSINRKLILRSIYQNIMDLYHNFDILKIQSEYFEFLYKKQGFQSFKTVEESFIAKIFAVHEDGRLELETEDGEYRSFYFKEVSFESK